MSRMRVRRGLLKLMMVVVLIGALAACVEENGDGAGSADPGGATSETPTQDFPVDDATRTTDDPGGDTTPTPDDAGDEDPAPTPGGSDDDATGLAYELIASGKTLPEGLVEPTIQLGQSEEEYADLWAEFGFEESAPDVDWERDVALFVGTGESGTCPLELQSVEHDPDERLLTVDVREDTEEDTPCTDDWTPRAFVITLGQEVVDEDELTVSLSHSGSGPGEIHRVDVMAQDEWFDLLVTEKSYPEQRIGTNVLELAEDEARFDELWDWFAIEESERPEVDWGSQIVLFAGTGEPNGCPLVLDDLSFDQDERYIEVRASRDVPEDTMCTADWTPRLFVIAMDAQYPGGGELRAAIGKGKDGEYEFTADDGVVIREE